MISKNIKYPNVSLTYRVKLQEHLCHSLGRGDLQLHLELVGGEVEGRRHLAALQLHREEELPALTGAVSVLVSQQVEVLTDKVQPLVRFQSKPLGPGKKNDF